MNDWLNSARNLAEERFRSLPFPNSKDENFRFTPLAYGSEIHALKAPARAIPESFTSLDPEEAALLVLKGETAKVAGDTKGFFFTDLPQAVTLGSELVRSQFRSDAALGDDKFAQLTSARWKSGAFVHVPQRTKLAKPIRFLTCPELSEEHFRHLIVLEEGAEAVIVQESWSDDSARFFGELTTVRMGRNSRLHWVVLQELGVGVDAVIRQRIELAEGAELRITPLHLGAKLIQTRQETHLVGEGASIETQGAARGDQSQLFDFWLDVRHESPRSRSNMDYWFVMAGKSKGIFNAQIEIKQGASDCESSQKSKSLLLGGGSVHSIPKLIIKTDAVKCSHGASVASVNFEQLHYLQSRGIPRAEAERMIVRGFTEVVVERLPTEAMRARAEAMLDVKEGGIHL